MKDINLKKSTLVVMFFSLFGKILGFVKEILIATIFGSSYKTDAYFIATTANSVFTELITVALGTTYIPTVSEIESLESNKKKVLFTNNILNLISLISIILVIFSIVFAPYIVSLLAKDFSGEQYSLAVLLTRIGSPKIFLGALIGIFSGYLQSENRFYSTAAGALPFNIIYIIYLFYYSKDYGIQGLMIATVLAVASQLLLQVPDLINSNYQYKMILNFKDKNIHKMLKMSIPIFIGVAINDINVIVDKSLASTLTTGSISALNYSNRINYLFLGIFISSITTVVYPSLSTSVRERNKKKFNLLLINNINLILFFSIPVSIGLIVLSEPFIRIVFQRGQFDSVATAMTSTALTFYTLGLPFLSLRQLFDRVFYSLHDTKTPVFNGFIVIIFNILLNFLLIKPMKIGGLALSTSIATFIGTVLMYNKLRNILGPEGQKNILLNMLKVIFASFVMGIIAFIMHTYLRNFVINSLLKELIVIALIIIISILLYIYICYILEVSLVKELINIKLKERK